MTREHRWPVRPRLPGRSPGGAGLRACGTVLAALLPVAAWSGGALLPQGARLTHEQVVSATWAWAHGAWDGTEVPMREVGGPVRRQVWQIALPPGGVEALAVGVRAALEEAGYALAFECEARGCGGFDFRFGADILPEPQMHVDLASFRYLAAHDADLDEHVAVVLSRGSGRAYVEVSRAGGAAAPAATASSRSPDAAAAPHRAAMPEGAAHGRAHAATPPGEALLAHGSLVLEDVVFDVGAASLSGPAPATLEALAAWLRADPGRQVALVGHTDATGALPGNVALSRRRAEAVRAALVSLGVPEGQVTAEGVGYLAPRAENITEEGRARNRRVEAVLVSLP